MSKELATREVFKVLKAKKIKKRQQMVGLGSILLIFCANKCGLKNKKYFFR